MDKETMTWVEEESMVDSFKKLELQDSKIWGSKVEDNHGVCFLAHVPWFQI